MHTVLMDVAPGLVKIGANWTSWMKEEIMDLLALSRLCRVIRTAAQ